MSRAQSKDAASLLPGRTCRCLKRKPEKESRAFPHFAVEPNFAFMTFDDDRIRESEPLTSPLADGLTREKRLENPRSNVVRNTGSSVGNCYLHRSGPLSCSDRDLALSF